MFELVNFFFFKYFLNVGEILIEIISQKAPHMYERSVFIEYFK